MIPETANIPCHNLSLKATGVDDSAMARVGEKHRMEGGNGVGLGLEACSMVAVDVGPNQTRKVELLKWRERERERGKWFLN